MPKVAHVLGDTAYDSDHLRSFLAKRASTAVIKPSSIRTNVPDFDAVIYKLCNLIERAFSHLKDWRRIATRYDKLSRNFHATVALAAIMIWWV